MFLQLHLKALPVVPDYDFFDLLEFHNGYEDVPEDVLPYLTKESGLAIEVGEWTDAYEIHDWFFTETGYGDFGGRGEFLVDHTQLDRLLNAVTEIIQSVMTEGLENTTKNVLEAERENKDKYGKANVLNTDSDERDYFKSLVDTKAILEKVFEDYPPNDYYIYYHAID